MQIKYLEILNYRALESAQINNISSFNVFIGRNNSGKSSVFGALRMVETTLFGGEHNFWREVTNFESDRQIKITLRFEPSFDERKQLINALEYNGVLDTKWIKTGIFQRMEFTFVLDAITPNKMRLQETRISAEDDKWARIQWVNPQDSRNGVKTIHYTLNLNSMLANNITDFSSENMGRKEGQYALAREIESMQLLNFAEPTGYLLKLLHTWFTRTFFFESFRHSMSQLKVTQTDILSKNGDNLALVLNTINNNNRDLFNDIEGFVQAAIPEIGRLQSPLTGDMTEVSFRLPSGPLVRLQDMGGGVEHLLMVAVVLLTTSKESSVFLEEPESHLHAGAQRFLIERLRQDGRQVFVTTHSPTFINQPHSITMFRVNRSGGKTTLTQVADEHGLSTVLEDIGARNSDVLLSDAVVFVEGPGDKSVLTIWSETLGTPLEEKNVTILHMEGGDASNGKARMRSNVLAGISQKSPVPHIFVLDRDERSEKEIAQLHTQIGERLHLFKCRELENYLLIPHAIISVIRQKLAGNAEKLAKLDNITEEDVMRKMQDTANSLYNTVLAKRIRHEFGGLQGGFLPRDVMDEVALAMDNPRRVAKVRTILNRHVKNKINTIDIKNTILRQRSQLNQEWANHEHRLSIAPGEELIEAVFAEFGLRYSKSRDTGRIAAAMHKEDINDEIVKLINQILNL